MINLIIWVQAIVKFHCISDLVYFYTINTQIINNRHLLFYFRSNKIEKLLFSWNNYVQYIECRNSVTSNYIYSQHKNVYGNKIHDTELFINDWNLMMPTLPTSNN